MQVLRALPLGGSAFVSIGDFNSWVVLVALQQCLM
jgi:hypothetical protein